MKVSATSNGRIGFFNTTILLRKCRKTGKIIKDICLKAESEGTRSEEEFLRW